jgi:hypothetical protein
VPCKLLAPWRPWACPGYLQPPRPCARTHAYTCTSPHTHKEKHTCTDTAQDNRSCICPRLAPHPLPKQESGPRRRTTLACTQHTHPHPHTPVLPSRCSSESDGQWATPCAASTARPSALMPHPASPPSPHQHTYEVQEGALYHTCYHSFLLPTRLDTNKIHTHPCTHLYTHTALSLYICAGTMYMLMYICIYLCTCIYIYVLALSFSLFSVCHFLSFCDI